MSTGIRHQQRSGADPAEVELAVSGMTCGSCAARVERVLGRQPGVAHAAVNFATERATVAFDPAAVTIDDLVAAVGRAGYGVAPAADEAREVDSPDSGAADPEAAAQLMWRRRLLVAWPLGLAVLVLSMGFMHDRWARLTALALTVPVQFWAGRPFLEQAAMRARSLQANMDTLIAVGTLSAFTYSAYQVLVGHEHSDHYLDTSAVVIAFLLLGRYFEARAKGRAARSVRALLELGAK